MKRCGDRTPRQQAPAGDSQKAPSAALERFTSELRKGGTDTGAIFSTLDSAFHGLHSKEDQVGFAMAFVEGVKDAGTSAPGPDVAGDAIRLMRQKLVQAGLPSEESRPWGYAIKTVELVYDYKSRNRGVLDLPLDPFYENAILMVNLEGEERDRR